MNTKKRYSNIDLLKGVAMILIVLLHSVQMIEGIPEIIRKPLLFGQIGVPLFFMCSGFLVRKTYLNNEEKITLKGHIKYIWKKYISLALPFVLFLIIYMLVNALFRYLGIEVPYENNTQPISILLNVFLLHGFFSFCLNNVAPGAWYIGTLFILLLTAPIYTSIKGKRNFMPLIVSVVMAVLSLVLSDFFSVSVDNGSFFYFSFLNQLPAFLIGMEMADEEDDKIKLCGSTLRFLKSLIFFVLVMLLFVAELTFSYALVPFFSAMAFKEIYFLLESFRDYKIKYSSKTLIYIGKNTYPIYLAHFLLVWYIPIIVKRYFELNGILLWIVALVSAFVLFVVSNKLNAFFAMLIKLINKKRIKKKSEQENVW